MNDRIMITGGGGREHALGWKLAQSPEIEYLDFAPGNAGTDGIGANIHSEIAADVSALAAYAQKHEDFVIVSAEDLLAEGAIDRLKEEGVSAFGPTQAAAQLEASKAYAAAAKRAFGVPSPDEEAFDSYVSAKQHVRVKGWGSIVIKADGLAKGKGVVVPASAREADKALHDNLVEKRFGAASERVVIQERLEGPELSVFALADGARSVMLPSLRDYKRLKDDDKGPNTGGMGAWGPVEVDADMAKTIEHAIVRPTIEGMAESGRPYRGMLYTGLMLTAEGPKVIEYNARFGDPECQAQMLLLDEDLYPRLQQAARGDLDETPLRLRPGFAVTVALAAPGYPDESKTGSVIQGLHRTSNVEVFHAGTVHGEDQKIKTAGGRVLHVAAYGETLREARAKVYGNIGKHGIHFAKKQYRRDIAVSG